MLARMRNVISRFPLRQLTWLLAGVTILFTLTGCQQTSIGILNPKGIIAYQERKLFFDTLALMLIVVLPVIVMSFTFIYHYQQSHKITDYKPNWSHSLFLESIWWGVPCAIIFVMAVLTWKKTHELDPYSPIAGHDENPMIVQVIALPWKWLFIYPEQQIASLNYLELPVNRPVEFWLTADNTPMSALFIPQLGSQIYVMAGMRTRLNLYANATGTFDGMNTQYSGDGFSDMHFPTVVVEQSDFDKWVSDAKQSSLHLDAQQYRELLNSSIADKPKIYSQVQSGLFNDAINIYMHTYGTLHPRNNQMVLRQE